MRHPVNIFIADMTALTPRDRIFLDRVAAIVMANISAPGFSVKALADEVGMSRTQLHRRLSALTQQNCGQFISTIRLERAADLLREEPLSIGEIAYRVGFKNPSYFTKCFKRRFGCLPKTFVLQQNATSVGKNTT